jgi:hypothetical protein
VSEPDILILAAIDKLSEAFTITDAKDKARKS